MIIRLLSNQVPQLWEAIKFASVQADEVDEKDRPHYLNELLHSLLSNKAQAFVRLDENRTLLATLITRFAINKVSGEKSLDIQCLYSWKAQPEEVWREEFIFITTYAASEGCKKITFNSRNTAIQELSKTVGFKEQTRTFSLAL